MTAPPPPSWRGRALALSLLMCMPACAGISYEHRTLEQPPLERSLAMLDVGRSDLQTCLDLLGAPNQVRQDEQSEGFELRWEWDETSAWGFFITIPTGTDFSPSVNWENREAQTDFLRLFFSADGRLQRLSRG